jgi:hypothetical protein
MSVDTQNNYYKVQSSEISIKYAKEIAEYRETSRLISDLLLGSGDYLSFSKYIKNLSTDSINSIIREVDYSESSPFQPIVTFAEIAARLANTFEEFVLVSNTIKKEKIAIMKIIFGICNTELHSRSNIIHIEIEDSS